MQFFAVLVFLTPADGTGLKPNPKCIRQTSTTYPWLGGRSLPGFVTGGQDALEVRVANDLQLQGSGGDGGAQGQQTWSSVDIDPSFVRALSPPFIRCAPWSRCCAPPPPPLSPLPCANCAELRMERRNRVELHQRSVGEKRRAPERAPLLPVRVLGNTPDCTKPVHPGGHLHDPAAGGAVGRADDCADDQHHQSHHHRHHRHHRPHRHDPHPAW